jgi:hypothetical protein
MVTLNTFQLCDDFTDVSMSYCGDASEDAPLFLRFLNAFHLLMKGSVAWNCMANKVSVY